MYLVNLFGTSEAEKLISKYFIGTSKYWKGACVFWQIDIEGNIRTGKIMLYNLSTGNRIKKPYDYIAWEHNAIKQPEYNLKQCLFGEHLLKDKTKPVAIVESEKTAIIASIYFPKLIWVAVGSLNNLNAERCKILKGRNVILYPDSNGFQIWSDKANELSYITNFVVSNLLECKAHKTDKINGLDIADYLTKFDYKQFYELENTNLENQLETSFI